MRPHRLNFEENTVTRELTPEHTAFIVAAWRKGEVTGACAPHALPLPPKAFLWVSIGLMLPGGLS